MDINDTLHQIHIAQQQAVISERKMNYWKEHGQPYKVHVYRVRMKALKAYVKVLNKSLKAHNCKVIKRNNR